MWKKERSGSRNAETGPCPSAGRARTSFVPHTPLCRAMGLDTTCVGCHDNEIETEINNSHSANSLTFELTCHYNCSRLGQAQTSGAEHLWGRLSEQVAKHKAENQLGFFSSLLELYEGIK